MWIYWMFLLTLAPFSRADVSLGTVAGGTLKAVEEVDESEGETNWSFYVEWRKGKQKRKAVLAEESMPTVGGDDYSLASAKRDGNEIKVVVSRLGHYDYRGNDRTTYRVSFDPKRLRFSKVRGDTVSDEDKAKERIRAFFRKSCNPLSEPSDDFISENVSLGVRDANSVQQEDIYGLLFEEMHTCAQKEFRKGNKGKARRIVADTVSGLDSVKDWICQANNPEEKPAECETRKENFLTIFTKASPGLANDMGFFLSGDAGTNPLAREVLRAVVFEAPKRAVARLNYADVLWDLGDRAEAKEQYQEYLKLTSDKTKGAKKEREKARGRVGK